jgi:hypothetical protein
MTTTKRREGVFCLFLKSISSCQKHSMQKLYHDSSRDRLRIRILLSVTRISQRGEEGGGEPSETEVMVERRDGSSDATRRWGAPPHHRSMV